MAWDRLTPDEIEELLAYDAWRQRNGLEGHMDEKLNHITSDIRYQDARRDAPGRDPLNLGTARGYPLCDPNDVPERSSWWLVLVAAGVFALGMWLTR